MGESGLAGEAARRILALGLPDGSGMDVCREIRSADTAIATLILPSHDDDDALFAAKAGQGVTAILGALPPRNANEAARRCRAARVPSSAASVVDAE